MRKKRKRSGEEIVDELLRTDENFRRLAERIEARRTPEERERLPLGSKAFSDDVTRRLRERIERGG